MNHELTNIQEQVLKHIKTKLPELKLKLENQGIIVPNYIIHEIPVDEYQYKLYNIALSPLTVKNVDSPRYFTIIIRLGRSVDIFFKSAHKDYPPTNYGVAINPWLLEEEDKAIKRLIAEFEILYKPDEWGKKIKFGINVGVAPAAEIDSGANIKSALKIVDAHIEKRLSEIAVDIRKVFPDLTVPNPQDGKISPITIGKDGYYFEIITNTSHHMATINLAEQDPHHGESFGISSGTWVSNDFRPAHEIAANLIDEFDQQIEVYKWCEKISKAIEKLKQPIMR